MNRFRSEVDIATTLKLWGFRRRDYPGWHAVIEPDQDRLICLFEPGSDPTRLIADAAKENVSISPRFLAIFSLDSLAVARTKLAVLQPGSGVYARNIIAGPGSVGTLGGFLQFQNPTKKDAIWAFGCRHILGEAAMQSHPDEILDLHENTVSSVVISVPWNRNVDVSAAEMATPADADPNYSGIRVESPSPIYPPAQAEVQKIGFKTHLTSGIFLGYSLAVDVRRSLTEEKMEFGKQLIIGSLPNQPFLDKGDSGSLVISNGHPIGLLFARTESNEEGSPFGLATQFDEVLVRLTETIPNPDGRSLQLMLKQH